MSKAEDFLESLKNPQPMSRDTRDALFIGNIISNAVDLTNAPLIWCDDPNSPPEKLSEEFIKEVGRRVASLTGNQVSALKQFQSIIAVAIQRAEEWEDKVLGA